MASTDFLETKEEDISARFLVRYCGYLREEIADLPEWHPLHHELTWQLKSLEKRVSYGPREI